MFVDNKFAALSFASTGQNSTRDPNIGRTVDANLLVTFVSSQNSGLLFLATGTSQYLLLELANGTLRVRLNSPGTDIR